MFLAYVFTLLCIVLLFGDFGEFWIIVLSCNLDWPRNYCVAQDGLKFTILSTHSPKGWDYRPVLTISDYIVSFELNTSTKKSLV